MKREISGFLFSTGRREAIFLFPERRRTATAVAGLSNQLYRTSSALFLLDGRNGASSPEGMQALQEALKGMSPWI